MPKTDPTWEKLTPAEQDDYMLGLVCMFFTGSFVGFAFHWFITILQWKGIITP